MVVIVNACRFHDTKQLANAHTCHHTATRKAELPTLLLQHLVKPETMLLTRTAPVDWTLLPCQEPSTTAVDFLQSLLSMDPVPKYLLHFTEEDTENKRDEFFLSVPNLLLGISKSQSEEWIPSPSDRNCNRKLWPLCLFTCLSGLHWTAHRESGTG